MTKLFQVDIASSGWAYIWSVNGPPFVDEECPKCGRIVSVTRHRAIRGEAEGPSGRPAPWPDYIECTEDLELFIVSQRVLEVLKSEAVTGFDRAYEVKVKPAAELKEAGEPPKYSYLDITGRIDINWEASGMTVEGYCDRCHGEKQRTDPERFVPYLDSWDGSDLFRPRNYSSGFVFCTEKVLLLARKHQWKGFRFDPMDTPRELWPSHRGIDYLGKKWPPAWYPPGETGMFGD